MDTMFKEQQKFRQPLIFSVLLLLLGVSIWGVVQQVILKRPFGNNPTSDAGLVLFTLIPVLLFLMFWYLQQLTIISKDFIDIYITPFGRRQIKWEEVKKAYIRDYKPLLEYGGWGIRYSFRGKGVAYSVGGGKKGLQLELKNGKKILIGTKQAEKMQDFLERNHIDILK